jgi:hypothetical protein
VARDVGGVVAVLGACVDEHEVAGARGGVVRAVVQHAGVGAGADDAAVRGFGIVGAEHAFEFGLQFVFAHAGARGAHRGLVRVHADVGRALHQLDLVGRLEQAHLVEQVAQLEEFMRRLRAHAHLRAHAVEPADQLEVELRVAAEVVVHARAAFEQARQDVVEVGDGVRIVHAEVGHGAVLAGARAIPGFAVGVALAAEQDRLAVRAARHQHQHRFGFGEPVRYQKSESCR